MRWQQNISYDVIDKVRWTIEKQKMMNFNITDLILTNLKNIFAFQISSKTQDSKIWKRFFDIKVNGEKAKLSHQKVEQKSNVIVK